jgi:GDP-D-mannose dehydratase
MESKYRPGLLLDACNHIVFTVVASDCLCVSIGRFDYIPDWEKMADAILEGEWIMLQRRGAMYQVSNSEKKPVEALTTPQARQEEKDLKDAYEPRQAIMLPVEIADA